MDLVYIWYDDRYWSKILFSTIQGSGNIENWIGPADDVIT